MIASLPEILQVIEGGRGAGWVLEPDAKRLLALSGIDVPRFTLARSPGDAARFADEIGYPVVAKVVSPAILHKSDVDGVVAGIVDAGRLEEAFRRFRGMTGFAGMIVEEMVSGVELILGAKVDFQFGPMILLGMGGTGVEIYGDICLRMAPLVEEDVLAMIEGLTARRLLMGYRGRQKADLDKLTGTVLAFSALVMELGEKIESMEINPLMCSAGRCVAADARIILARP